MSRAIRIYIFLVISACAHTSNRPSVDYLRTLQDQDPTELASFEEKLDPASAEVRSRWAKYLAAKESSPEAACSAFYELSEDSEFKLRELALLQALKVCEADFAPLADRPLHYDNYKDTYLAAEALDALIAWGEKRKDGLALMELYHQKSRHQTLQSEKLDSMDRALALATQLKLKDKVAQFEQRIESLAPRRIKNPKWEQLYEVAQDYRQARMFPEAVDAYQKYMRHRRAGPDQGYQALRGLRELRRLTRNESQELYLTSTKNLASFTERMYKRTPRAPWIERHHAMSVQWARTLWTYGRRSEAEAVLEKLSQQIKGKHSLALIYWLRSRIELEKGALDTSMNFLKLAQNQTLTDSSLAEDVYWDLAWGQRKLGKLEQAVKAFEELEVKTTQESQKFKSMFWRAKTLAQRGQSQEATKVFEELAAQDVVGVYGQLAYNELGRPLPAIPSAPTYVADTPETLEWLLAVKERELALSFVEHLWKEKSSKDLSQRETLGMLQLFARCGEFLKLFRYFSSLPPDQQKDLIQENYSLLFPQIYASEIEAASQKLGVPQALIYSIIRQESAFNPKARSWADAFGLMQLLPSVGQKMAQAHQVSYTGFEDLYTPSTNITLGTAFLKRLLSAHQNQFIIVVAAYNASERAIYNWIETRFVDDPLEFIEEIPYRETQGYVKLVLRNYVFYQRLLTSQQSIPFPAGVLSGLGEIKAALSQYETPEN